jgi:hypothetical protein
MQSSNADLALLISGISLAVSVAGFVWGIFKEFIYVKPKLRVGFAVFIALGEGRRQTKTLGLSVTNMGPGPAIIHSCNLRIWKGWFRRDGWGLINPLIHPEVAHTSGPFTGLPVELQPGQSRTFYFQYARECFLNFGTETITRFGVHDTYGRNHFASRRAVRRAKESYAKDFSPPATSPTNAAA